MTYKIGPKGQVVIPKAIRDELGLEPGDEVTVSVDGRRVVVERPDDRLMRWQGAFKGHNLTEMLEADRRAEPR